MQEAIALKRNTETLQEYLSTKIAEEKNLTEAAIKREHEAAERSKEADEAKRAADDQVKLLKADRERQEKRLVELLAHDPCGAKRREGALHRGRPVAPGLAGSRPGEAGAGSAAVKSPAPVIACPRLKPRCRSARQGFF